MAEALFDEAVDRSSRLKGDVRSQSAGTFAAEGAEATREAIEIMEEMDLDIRRHRSQQFNPELCDWADLVLTMESRHIEELEAMAPAKTDKFHTLLGFIDGIDGFAGEEKYDIADPYREPMEEYRKCALQIKDAVKKLVRKLEETWKDEE